MVKTSTNTLLQIIAVSALLSLSGCSRVNSLFDTKDRVNYQSNRSVKILDFPPDLTAPEYDNEFELPSGVTNTVSMRTGGVVNQATVAAVAATSNLGKTSTNAPSASVNRSAKLSSLIKQGSTTMLRVNDSYPRAVVMTGIMLDRMKFVVTNRAESVYQVTYQGQDMLETPKKGGFLSNGFEYLKSLTEGYNNKVLAKGGRYQVHINNQQGVPLVSFKGENGKQLPSGHNAKILTLLDAEFNR